MGVGGGLVGRLICWLFFVVSFCFAVALVVNVVLCCFLLLCFLFFIFSVCFLMEHIIGSVPPVLLPQGQMAADKM